jgi:hypothetical protein
VDAHCGAAGRNATGHGRTKHARAVARTLVKRISMEE